MTPIKTQSQKPSHPSTRDQEPRSQLHKKVPKATNTPEGGAPRQVQVDDIQHKGFQGVGTQQAMVAQQAGLVVAPGSGSWTLGWGKVEKVLLVGKMGTA